MIIGVVNHTDSTGRMYMGLFDILLAQSGKETDTYSFYTSILAEAMKNRGDTEMLISFNNLVVNLTERGLKPKYHVLENETYEEIKHNIKKWYIIYQIVQSGKHRTNNTKRSIHTFKKHIVAGL